MDLNNRFTKATLYAIPLNNMVRFIWQQLNAAIFGILLLMLIVMTYQFYPIDLWVSRSDFLAISAITIQILLWRLNIESLKEIRVVFIFHMLGTMLEIFKTQVGSWQYPQDGILFIGHVPLFAGFMYASVGSYMLRLQHVFTIRYRDFPSSGLFILLAVLSYINFMTHHYYYDLRWILMLLSFFLLRKTHIEYRLGNKHYQCSLISVLISISILIWMAENIATYYGIWFYPDQKDFWTMVSVQKIVAWYLLILTTLVLCYLCRGHDS